jgi:hypothetical protein
MIKNSSTFVICRVNFSSPAHRKKGPRAPIRKACRIAERGLPSFARMNSRLLIDAACEKAAVNDEDFAIDETGRVGCQKNGGARQLFNLSEALQRRTQ